MQNLGVWFDGRAYPKPKACQTQLDSRRQVDATTLSNVDLVYDPSVPITHTCGARMHINLHELAITRRMLICLLWLALSLTFNSIAINSVTAVAVSRPIQ